ncbi:hypothetical protein B296_00015953, partial [Ensete ventricosum]
ACWEFTGSSPRVIGGLLGARKLARSSRAYWELAEGDRELVGNASGFANND